MKAVATMLIVSVGLVGTLALASQQSGRSSPADDSHRHPAEVASTEVEAPAGGNERSGCSEAATQPEAVAAAAACCTTVSSAVLEAIEGERGGFLARCEKRREKVRQEMAGTSDSVREALGRSQERFASQRGALRKQHVATAESLDARWDQLQQQRDQVGSQLQTRFEQQRKQLNSSFASRRQQIVQQFEQQIEQLERQHEAQLTQLQNQFQGQKEQEAQQYEAQWNQLERHGQSLGSQLDSQLGQLEKSADRSRKAYETHLAQLDDQTGRHLKQLETQFQLELELFEKNAQQRLVSRRGDCRSCRNCRDCRQEGRCQQCQGCGDPECERDMRRREREAARKDLVSKASGQ